MPATVTITAGVTGPGIAVTAAVFTQVATFTFSTTGKEVLSLTYADGRPPIDISIAAVTTITITVSGANYTVTMS